MGNVDAGDTLAQDAARILEFGTRLAQLSGAYHGMNKWRHGRTIWSDQAFLLNASMQALSHAIAITCISLLSDNGNSSDVNFRRIRKAMDDPGLVSQLVRDRATEWAVGAGDGPSRYELYSEKLSVHSQELTDLLKNWDSTTPEYRGLKRFRDKRIAHTTSIAAQTTNGIVWKAETAVLRAATLSNVLFAGGGVDLEDDRRIAQESAVSALNRFTRS